MKKLFVLALAIGMMTSCGYQSVTTPIEGTSLYTYTANVDGKIVTGVKKMADPAAGPQVKTDQTVIEAAYTGIGYKNGSLLGITGNQATVYTTDGHKIFGPAEGLLIYKDGYFGINESDKLTTYIDPKTAIVVGPRQNIVVTPEALLIQQDGLCGISDKKGAEIIKAEYESIVRVTEPLGKDYFYLAKVKGKAQWKKIGADGKVIKVLAKWQVDKIKADAKKLGGQSFGDETLGGITVKNLKAY